MITKDILTGAAFLVLFVCTSIFGLMGKPKEMFLSIIAAAIGLSFINIDKIKRFKGAGFEAEMQEKIEAIIEKETEPEENNSGFRIEGYATDGKAQKTIKALLNPKYTLRYIEGISKETGLSKKEVLETLNWLSINDLGKFTEGEHGRLWSLTSKGRSVFKNLQNA